MDIQTLRKAIQKRNYKETLEFTKRRMERKIWIKEVFECIMDGEIIEEYPNDHRGRSCLIYGKTKEGRHLHVCCSMFIPLWLITTYEPSLDKWEENRKTRRQK